MIDWQQMAKNNGMSPEELDNQEDGTIVKFTASDEIGPLELYIKRGITEDGS